MTPGTLAAVVTAFAVLVLLVLGASHPVLRALERRLGLSALGPSGAVFLFIGLALGEGGAGVLTELVLQELRPAVEFGLGWLGLAVGLRLELRTATHRLSVAGRGAVLQAVPAALLGGAGASLVLGLFGVPLADAAVLVVLVAAAAGASGIVPAESVTEEVGEPVAQRLEQLTGLGELVSLALLGLGALLLREDATGAAWRLPPSAWVTFAIGLATLLGTLTWLLLRSARSAAEELALLLGAVGLIAGTAGGLVLPVPVLAALAGAVLANLPGTHESPVRAIVHELERPLLLLLLVVLGAGWRPLAPAALALGGVFVAARLLGRLGGAVLLRRVSDELPPTQRLTSLLLKASPVLPVLVAGGLPLAPDAAVGAWVGHGVLAGALVTQLLPVFSLVLKPRPLATEPI